MRIRMWRPKSFEFLPTPPPLPAIKKKDIHTNKYVTQYSVKYIFFLFWCIQIPITPWCVESPFRSCNLNYLLSIPSCLGVVFIFNTNSKLITLNKSIQSIWGQLKTEHEDSFKIGLDYLPTTKISDKNNYMLITWIPEKYFSYLKILKILKPPCLFTWLKNSC